ncbi:3'-phosphoesterase [bacterium]|nr:3'-phosphoesterase [bacterium]
MVLEEYKHKRKKGRTPEPFSAAKKGKRVFVIQKHFASHRHWDFRLAYPKKEGWVLKSWAIPKEPPQKPGVKRLAMQTEDHPYAYKDFEGRIPEGEYGAGKVVIWDKGSYKVLRWSPELIEVKLKGRRLRGVYVLLKPAGFRDKEWLFFKK